MRDHLFLERLLHLANVITRQVDLGRRRSISERVCTLRYRRHTQAMFPQMISFPLEVSTVVFFPHSHAAIAGCL